MRPSVRLFACGIALWCGWGCVSLDPLASYSDGPGLGSGGPPQSGTLSETPDAALPGNPLAVGNASVPDGGILSSEGEPNVDSSGLGAEGSSSGGGSEADAGAISALDAGTTGCNGAGEFLGPGATSCYRLVSVGANWNDAALACQSWGGDLVQVDSLAEDTFLTGRVQVQIWIGASDQAVEGRWVWSGGAPLFFGDWGPGQPDNYLGIEDCAVMLRPTGTWNDVPCTDLNPYVCERPAP
jgi:hypothetical protein